MCAVMLALRNGNAPACNRKRWLAMPCASCIGARAILVSQDSLASLGCHGAAYGVNMLPHMHCARRKSSLSRRASELPLGSMCSRSQGIWLRPRCSIRPEEAHRLAPRAKSPRAGTPLSFHWAPCAPDHNRYSSARAAQFGRKSFRFYLNSKSFERRTTSELPSGSMCPSSQ